MVNSATQYNTEQNTGTKSVCLGNALLTDNRGVVLCQQIVLVCSKLERGHYLVFWPVTQTEKVPWSGFLTVSLRQSYTSNCMAAYFITTQKHFDYLHCFPNSPIYNIVIAVPNPVSLDTALQFCPSLILKPTLNNLISYFIWKKHSYF